MKKTLIIILSLILFNSCCKEGDDTYPHQKLNIRIAGFENNGLKSVATVWENGIETNLSDGTQDAYLQSIFVDMDNIYIVGFENNGTKNVAKIWKNGIATNLSDGTQNASAKSVFVKNNDVYIAGIENNGIKSDCKNLEKRRCVRFI